MVQKPGLCICSQVPAILSKIFLASAHRVLEGTLATAVVKCFRFVDDYLILIRSQAVPRNVNDILDALRKEGMGLSFTYEMPTNQRIQFLDFQLTFTALYIC